MKGVQYAPGGRVFEVIQSVDNLVHDPSLRGGDDPLHVFEHDEIWMPSCNDTEELFVKEVVAITQGPSSSIRVREALARRPTEYDASVCSMRYPIDLFIGEFPNIIIEELALRMILTIRSRGISIALDGELYVDPHLSCAYAHASGAGEQIYCNHGDAVPDVPRSTANHSKSRKVCARRLTCCTGFTCARLKVAVNTCANLLSVSGPPRRTPFPASKETALPRSVLTCPAASRWFGSPLSRLPPPADGNTPLNGVATARGAEVAGWEWPVRRARRCMTAYGALTALVPDRLSPAGCKRAVVRQPG